MKKLYLIVPALTLYLSTHAQVISLQDIMSLTAAKSSRFQQYAEKRGFQTEDKQSDFLRMQYTRDSGNAFFLTRQWNEDGGWMQLERISVADYEQLKQTMKREGFTAGETDAKVHTELFEKGPMLITASPEIDLEEGKRLYNIVIQNKMLPKAKDLQFAEDLLQFDSHQQLVYVLGANNVKQDEFILPDGSTMACSVIHPQSPYEAVFIWKDAANMRSIYELRVGGNTRTKSALKYNSSIAQNRWVSRQGVYTTMTLDQLCAKNEAPVNFFGWGEQYSGQLAPDNTGRLNLSQLSFVFSCFNCNDDKYYGDTAHNATNVINDQRRVYITTMILKPEAPTD